jgi:hypothetical protein
MWGIAWQLWAMIGFTIFWISLGLVIWQQHSQIKKLTSSDAEQAREEQQLRIEELKAKANERKGKDTAI